MAYRSDVLAPGHTNPVVGAEAIAEALCSYRDAIRHVMSQTVAGMNAGLDPVTIADALRLPAELAATPYLQEFYGHVGYASRAYFVGTLAWFDGNPTSLGQLPPAREAAKVIALARRCGKRGGGGAGGLDRGGRPVGDGAGGSSYRNRREACQSQTHENPSHPSAGGPNRQRANAERLPSQRARAGGVARSRRR